MLLPLFAWLVVITLHARLGAAENEFVGRTCMTVENFRPSGNESQFLECSPLSDEEVTGYGLGEKYLGVWNLRDCPENHAFDESKQRCVEKKKLRRQQALCSSTPSSPGCQTPCTATNLNPAVGGQCNWMTASLQPDPQSNAYFIQCTPQTAGSSCGEWVRTPCTSGTVFNQNTEICIPVAMNDAPSCQANYAPVCNCAPQTTYNCPGLSSCQNNVCCQPLPQNPLTMPQNQAPVLCLGSNIAPLSSCSNPCPPYSACQSGVGCCPVAVQSLPQPSLQITLCPGSYSPPIGTCNNCPTGSTCNQQIGGCCPTVAQPSTDIIYNVIILCPNGSPATEPCGNDNSCNSGNGCYQGACCPMTCPAGQSAVGFCGSAGCGSGNCYQPGGTCCLEAIQLPVCPNGVPSTTACTFNQQCGPGFECSNGGCCPMPFCPSGIQATNRCGGFNNGCLAGSSCVSGLCCPLPQCPSGVLAINTCTRAMDCGRPGFECSNGGCCPLPQCPTGVFASQRCNGNCGQSCCGLGQTCIGGGCCPLPQCPSGGFASSMCGGGSFCSSGSECVNGGCCPLPVCPNGIVATQRCNMGMGCGPGNLCENGVCCPMPMCNNMQVAVSVCGMGNACPIGYVCEGRGCCPEPMPLCPNGGRSAQRCDRGSDCPPGYGCTPLGGCCLLSLDPVCPQNQNAVCQCSPNNGCPPYASCNMGTCCSSAVAAYNQVPGSTCQVSSQCNGYSNQCSNCVQNTCVCTNGASSNGATCQQIPVTILTIARNGCDQYGSPCRFVLSSARRRPIFAPVGNITEEPLFFNVARERRCVANATNLDFEPDSTCLPSEKCINGLCRMKLWPGEYGCTTDLECSSRCPNTYCESRKTDRSVSQCQCKDGLLLYGRCFTHCPEGFHESGAYCMYDDEDKFWSDAEAQDRLKELLNAGQC